MDTAEPGLVPEYAEWLDRVTATYEAVSYTCRVRLGDRAVGEAVAERVARGLVARPAVFRHWGLPYSGRIAKLAEDAIAEALAGGVAGPRGWGPFRRALTEVPVEAQTTFVMTCVEGLDDEQVAHRCGCDPATAGQRRASVLDHMRALAAGYGGPHDEVTAMPLDWAVLQRDFGSGGEIPTVAGGKTLHITAVDDEYVHIRHSLWRDRLAREHLEKAVALVEADAMTRHSGLFAEEYRTMVADVRATSVAHVLKYLGVLE